MPAGRSDLARGTLIALISTVFLSTTGIFIRHLTQTYAIPALVLALWRDVFVVATLLPVLLVLRPRLLRVRRDQAVYLVGYGLVLALFNSFWTLSVAMNGAAVATVLVYSSAAFTALLGWWWLRERLHRGKVIAVLLGIGGCLLVSGALDPAIRSVAPPTHAAGIVTGVLSGLSYALYSLMGRSASQRGLNPWTSVFFTFGFAALALSIVNLQAGIDLPGKAAHVADLLWLGQQWTGWAVLFALAAVPTVAGFGLYNVSLSLLPSSVANLILTLEPPLTAVIAYFLLGERLSLGQIAGGLAILAGVIVLRIYEERLREPAPPGRRGSGAAVILANGRT